MVLLMDGGARMAANQPWTLVAITTHQRTLDLVDIFITVKNGTGREFGCRVTAAINAHTMSEFAEALRVAALSLDAPVGGEDFDTNCFLPH